MPKYLRSGTDHENKGNPKPQDKISNKLLDLLDILQELKFEFDREKTIEDDSIFKISNDKKHLTHLTDQQCSFFIELIDVCIWIINIILIRFWGLATTINIEEQEEQLKRMTLSLTNVQKDFVGENK